MSTRAGKGYDDDLLENNENVPVNGCDVRWRGNDKRDCSGSQEMFSDDDHVKDSAFSSPKVAMKNDTFNSSTLSLKTPILCSKVTQETPDRAAVPRTPADLLPYIRKTSILWTSDMETPDGKEGGKPEDLDKTINSTDVNNRTPNRQERTPNYAEVKVTNMDINTSPILGGKKRSKRRVKRRILTNVVLESDNNTDQQSSISSNSDKVPSETASCASNELVCDIDTDSNKLNTKEISSLNNKEIIESKKLHEAVTSDKNINTSTQDFFSNASFSSIDRLCCSVIKEENTNDTSDSETKTPRSNEVFKEKRNEIKESKTTNVSNDVLARVAAIRRNQKPLRRSTEISHTVIPKEVFHKSVIELELADAKFSQEKRKSLINQQKPLQLTSFAKLSSLENELNVNNTDIFIKKEEINASIHEVPAEIMDDWSTDNVLEANLKKESANILPTTSGIQIREDNNKDPNFFSASGKSIHINENNLNKCHKMYNEIESEIRNDSDFLTLKKSNTKVTTSKLSIKLSGNSMNLIKIKSTNDDLMSSNEHKLDKVMDGFATASGKGIVISEDKILDYAKVYNEIESENLNENVFLGLKKNTSKPKAPLILKKHDNYKQKSIVKVQLKNDEMASIQEKKYDSVEASEKLRLYEELNLQEFLKPKIEYEIGNSADDGFMKTGEKDIQISKEKENVYSNIYNDVDNDVDYEKCLLDVKKSKVSKLSVNQSKNNKPLLVFNEKKKYSNIDIPKKASEIKIELNSIDTNDGFATAGGKEITINDEKERFYSKIYNELEGSDENSLLNTKKNKISKVNTNAKSKEKASIVFNTKKINLNNKVLPVKVKDNIETESTGDGFSTGKGKHIKISEEKESHYSKLYNELSEDIQNEHSFFNKNKDNLLKSSGNAQSVNRPSCVLDQKETINVVSGIKFGNTDSDEAFYDLGDIEEFFVSTDSSIPSKALDNKQSSTENCFTISNSTHVSKKESGILTIPKNMEKNYLVTNQKEICDNANQSNIIKSCVTAVKTESLSEEEILKNKPQSYIGALKRKLDKCDAKKPERSRSFGGFPVNNDGISASKLNKSDPNNESFVNHPLQKGLSVSQCFDSHSDSLLSKVELTNLNISKVQSPDSTVVKIEIDEAQVESTIESSEQMLKKSNEFAGFSFQDCTNSFRLYSKMERYLKKQNIKYDDSVQISIENGETVTISNQTTLEQKLIIEHSKNLEVKKNQFESSYVLTEVMPKPKMAAHIIVKNINAYVKEAQILNKTEKIAEKRKHADTDSDTPLTTVKKPRIGSELQGRKLFSDESDTEDDNHLKNQVETENNLQQLNENQATEQVEEDLSEQRFIAVLQQEKIIRNKKRMKIKPTMGTFLRQRLVNSKSRTSWSDLVGDSVPRACSVEQLCKNSCDPKILEITASNATCYKFLMANIVKKRKVVTLDVGDGALLVFDENGHAGVSEFTEAFLAMPGVDPKLVPVGWVENHYRWIIWKLASVDRIRFSSTLLPKILTPERVMKELKYRYDREIDRSERPPLRKIIEKDDIPSRRMVLCISSIKEATNANEEAEKEARTILGLPRWKVEATDGWYSIPLTIDIAMSNNIFTGKLKEGTKIVTYGAELLNCERGFFPLEKPSDVSLKIYTNCTRRAKWDTKLGYQKSSRPIPVKLKNIITNGGMVGETTAVAVRVYPLLYREKTPDGQSIYRNARCEEKAAIAHERALELKADAMYAEAEKKLDSKKKTDSDEEIENSQVLSVSQTRKRSQNNWERKQEQIKEKIEMKVRQGLPPPRKVTPVLKVRLFDDRTTVILTIWGASEDSGYDIKEGNTITVYNAFASGTRGGELNLSANRITHIKTEPLLRLPYPSRICTLIPDMTGAIFEPKFCEFDTVGVVVSTGPAPHGMKNFEMVNLAYPRQNDAGTSAYLSILFWNGVSSFGYQSIFAPGACVACSNLEWRRNTSWSIAVAYCAEKSVFTANPRQQHLASELRKLKSLVKSPQVYAESCADELATELSRKPQPRSNQGTPSGSGVSHLSYCSPSDIISPGNAMIQRKLEMLSRYGNSPDVSPIVLSNSSARVKKEFTPVTRKT